MHAYTYSMECDEKRLKRFSSVCQCSCELKLGKILYLCMSLWRFSYSNLQFMIQRFENKKKISIGTFFVPERSSSSY